MYPALLDLKNKNCVVIGGGAVAERKVAGLLESGAAINVISPVLTEKLRGLVEQKKISHLARDYETGDLKTSYMTFGATGDIKVNEQIYEEAINSGVLVNIVDQPEKCSFYVPSMIKRGSLTIAISTDGKSPALAKHLREELEEQIGPEYGQYLEMLSEFRQSAREKYTNSPAKIDKAFQNVFESEALKLISRGDISGAKKRMAECI